MQVYYNWNIQISNLITYYCDVLEHFFSKNMQIIELLRDAHMRWYCGKMRIISKYIAVCYLEWATS